ncbi:MAG: tetratricopeptide repeat protein [Bacteroidales bacterium]|nr:tetratricopeptide repeat protein [Bacteroidales bacterium]
MKIILSTIIFFLVFQLEAQDNLEISTFKYYVENGNYQSALHEAKSLLATDSLNPGLWYETGKLYQLLQQYNNAILAFQKAWEIDTTFSVSLFALAKANKLAGKTNTSIRFYNKFLEKEPENMAALLNLAHIYRTNYKVDDAYKLYERLFEIDSTNVEYLRQMADCKESTGDLIEALELLQKAYVQDDANLLVIYDLTKLYINSHEFDTTISIIDKAVGIYPDEGLLYSRKGDAHYGKNHHYRSVPDYQKAIELGFKSYLTIQRLGASLFSIKRIEEAKETLEQLIVRDTLDYKVCIYLGNIYNELNNPDTAILFFDKAMDILTPAPMLITSIYTGKAESYGRKGKYYKQIEMIKLRQDATEKRFKSDWYLLEIADIYENKIMDKKTALKYYQQYWEQIKDLKWYSEDDKNGILSKINRLREEMHFEKQD